MDEIAEAICIGQDWDDDVRVVLFVRLAKGSELTDDLVKAIKAKIRTGASPRHVPAKIIAVADIPRTKSGKIVELAVREVVHGRPVKNKEALANPEALDLYANLAELRS
jgi:acetoacetyl-CoA synthetase